MKHDTTQKTAVIFRKWTDPDSKTMIGDGIIALFPYEPADDRAMLAESFEHVGQHGAASLTGVISHSRPAAPEEYASLKRELESPPYEYQLVLRQRVPRNAGQVRRRKIREARSS